jgi:hypothetical protein
MLSNLNLTLQTQNVEASRNSNGAKQEVVLVLLAVFSSAEKFGARSKGFQLPVYHASAAI